MNRLSVHNSILLLHAVALIHMLIQLLTLEFDRDLLLCLCAGYAESTICAQANGGHTQEVHFRSPDEICVSCFQRAGE